MSRRAMAALLADEADRSRRVAAFREELPHGELLRPSEIDEWVRQRHEEDSKEGLERAKRTNRSDEIQFGRSGIQPVFPGGTLNRLRVVADHLQGTYGWPLRAATNFVLTGAVPPVPSLTIKYKEYFRSPRLSRIILEVDPSVGPREVLREYRRVRALFIEKRIRRIGVKSAEVVLFHLERQKKKPSSTWHEAMTAWNDKWPRKPDFRFLHEATYALYFNRAVRNLLMADYEVPKRAGRTK